MPWMLPIVRFVNNATFDYGESEPFTWASLSPDCVNLALALESDDCSEKNHSPDVPISSSQFRMLNLSLEPESVSPISKGIKREDSPEEKVRRGRERDIDLEIEEIEGEIWQPSSKLKAPHLLKEEQNSKTIRHSEEVKKIDVAPVLSLKPRINYQGVNLGPAEITSAFKSRPSNKPNTTLVLSFQTRRKSCS